MPLDSEDKLQPRRGTHPASLNSAVPLTGAANFANSVRCTFPASARSSPGDAFLPAGLRPSQSEPRFPRRQRELFISNRPADQAHGSPTATAGSATSSRRRVLTEMRGVAWRGARSVSDAVGRAALHRKGSGRLLRRSTVPWAARGALCVAGGRGLDARWRSSHGKRHLFVSIRGSRQAEAAPPHAGGPARPKVPSSALGCVPSDLPRGKDWHRMSPALPGSSLPP